MRKPSERLTVALLAASLLLPALQAHARFTRLFGAALSPKDNLSECRPSVRKELARVDRTKWGKIQFDCAGGFIRSLYLPPDGRISTDINQFVKDHWRLFDAEPVNLVDAGTPWLTFALKRGGLTFHLGEIDTGKRPGPNGGEMIFYDFGPEIALPAGFATKPGFPKDQATAEALKIAGKRGHLPNQVENTELLIRNQCLKNFTPQLVWWVRIREAANKKSVSCFIDAGTGEACKWNQGCSSSSDLFEM